MSVLVCVCMRHLAPVCRSLGSASFPTRPCMSGRAGGRASGRALPRDDDSSRPIVPTVMYCQESPAGRSHLFRHQIKAERARTHTLIRTSTKLNIYHTGSPTEGPGTGNALLLFLNVSKPIYGKSGLSVQRSWS